MKAKISKDFLCLFFYDDDIEEDNMVEVYEGNTSHFNVGDEVEILKELPVGSYSDNQKSYVVFNPRNHESITVAACFLDFTAN